MAKYEVIDGKGIIPQGATAIEEEAFKERTDLVEMVIPDTVTRIGEQAFEGCTNLKCVVIPDSVTSIGIMAFYGCAALADLFIPKSVETIGLFAFKKCRGLQTIRVAEGNPHFDSREGCNAIIITPLNLLMVRCDNTVVPASVVGTVDEELKKNGRRETLVFSSPVFRRVADEPVMEAEDQLVVMRILEENGVTLADYSGGYNNANKGCSKANPIVIKETDDYVHLEYCLVGVLLGPLSGRGCEYRRRRQRLLEQRKKMIDCLTFEVWKAGSPSGSTQEEYFFDITAGFNNL